MKLTHALMTSALTVGFVACGGDGTGPGDGNNNTAGCAMDGATQLPAATSCNNGLFELTGEFTQDITLGPDKQFLLKGNVFIGDDQNPVTITILPGTTVYGDFDSQGALIIRRYAKINAVGTVDEPILFTSANAEGSRGRGDWGGLVINGRAPVNCGGASSECSGEGNSGNYGGTVADDSSGVMKYVKVEFAGVQFTEEDEFNGIALQGVGSNTVIDHLHVHMAADDGIEFFGGTVSAKHVLITGAGDDSIDWTFGWSGKLQFAVVKQYGDEANRGIEADNNGKQNDASPRSNPILSNLTLVGTGADAPAAKADYGILLRAGTEAKIHNSVVYGFKSACFNIDDEETFNHAWDGTSANPGSIRVDNNLFSCSGADTFALDAADAWNVETFVMQGNTGNGTMDPMMVNPMGEGSAVSFAPSSGSPMMGGAVMPVDAWFDSVSYLGAIDPSSDWTKEAWVSYPMN